MEMRRRIWGLEGPGPPGVRTSGLTLETERGARMLCIAFKRAPVPCRFRDSTKRIPSNICVSVEKWSFGRLYAHVSSDLATTTEM